MKQPEDTKTMDMSPTPATKKQARDMYAYTSAHQPSNITAFGWEECK